AIAIETRDNAPEIHRLCAALDHLQTRTCVEAERAMNRTLHGSCHVPVAAFAQLDGQGLSLHGMVGSATDGTAVRAYAEGPSDRPVALGQHVARELLAQGAGALIAASGG
ncbi:MAG: hydroxymethylbilane synthase, partial [Pseudomonadota bacterium]|nr:hydroxymethylbilane synthase [Pseudomonadota bacterium]